MSRKNKATAPSMAKNTALIFAAVTFVLGFFTGVGFTIYKTNSASNVNFDNTQSVDHAQKAKALEAEVESNPQNLQAWIQLGHVYFDTDQYSRAIEAYEKALQINPDNADVLTDLGVMYRRSGQSRQAIEKFDQAMEVDPKHEVSRLNKGIVLMHDLKDQNGAIKAWEELLEINPLAMAGKDQSVDQLIKHYKEGHDK